MKVSTPEKNPCKVIIQRKQCVMSNCMHNDLCLAYNSKSSSLQLFEVFFSSYSGTISLFWLEGDHWLRHTISAY